MSANRELFRAAEDGNIKFLIRAGADPTVRNRDGKTSRDLLKGEIAEILAEAERLVEERQLATAHMAVEASTSDTDAVQPPL